MMPLNLSLALQLLSSDQRSFLALKLGIAKRTLNDRAMMPQRFEEHEKPTVSAYLKEAIGIDLPPQDFLRPVQFGRS